MVMIRMSDPPGQKHVPLQFPAWVCMDEGSRANNTFKTSQLVLDRWGVQLLFFNRVVSHVHHRHTEFLNVELSLTFLVLQNHKADIEFSWVFCFATF
jgi:hypothetical protein